MHRKFLQDVHSVTKYIQKCVTLVIKVNSGQKSLCFHPERTDNKREQLAKNWKKESFYTIGKVK